MDNAIGHRLSSALGRLPKSDLPSHSKAEFAKEMGKESPSRIVEQPKGALVALDPRDFLLGPGNRGDFVELSDRIRYPGNTGQQFGSALADQLRPTDRTTQALFGRAEKLDIVRNTTEVPPDRFLAGFSAGDVMFQREASALVSDGTIGPGTFVLSSTGHDIPMMATLLKALDMSGVVHAPDYTDLDLGNGYRVNSQAETFGDEIKKYEEKNAADGSVSSFFLGIDGHRTALGEAGKFDTALLPDAAALKAAGVNRLVFLAEAPVGPVEVSRTEELQPYLEELASAGIEIVVRGVDPRLNFDR